LIVTDFLLPTGIDWGANNAGEIYPIEEFKFVLFLWINEELLVSFCCLAGERET
jgi:hypothetical protein